MWNPSQQICLSNLLKCITEGVSTYLKCTGPSLFAYFLSCEIEDSNELTSSTKILYEIDNSKIDTKHKLIVGNRKTDAGQEDAIIP